MNISFILEPALDEALQVGHYVVWVISFGFVDWYWNFPRTDKNWSICEWQQCIDVNVEIASWRISYTIDSRADHYDWRVR
jgi:hypothetical protein